MIFFYSNYESTKILRILTIIVIIDIMFTLNITYSEYIYRQELYCETMKIHKCITSNNTQSYLTLMKIYRNVNNELNIYHNVNKANNTQTYI